MEKYRIAYYQLNRQIPTPFGVAKFSNEQIVWPPQDDPPSEDTKQSIAEFIRRRNSPSSDIVEKLLVQKQWYHQLGKIPVKLWWRNIEVIDLKDPNASR